MDGENVRVQSCVGGGIDGRKSDDGKKRERKEERIPEKKNRGTEEERESEARRSEKTRPTKKKIMLAPIGVRDTLLQVQVQVQEQKARLCHELENV